MRRSVLPSRYWALLVTAIFATVAIAGVHQWEGVVRAVPASYPICLTCSCPGPDIKWGATGGLKPGVPPGTGESVAFESKGEHCVFGWNYLGKRGTADWYQMTISRPLRPGSLETQTREFAYKGRPVVVFKTNGASIIATPDFSLADAPKTLSRPSQVP